MAPPFVTCSQCKKVCKSTRGLRQHSTIHRRPAELENTTQDFHREYHPLLSGNYYCSIYLSLYSSIFEELPVTAMEIFFHQGQRQHHHLQNRTTTGPRSHHGLGLSSPKYYISRPISLKASSINFSISGVPHSSPMTISPLSLTTKTSTHRSTRLSWETSRGNHTLPNISGSVLRAVQYQSG